jgi:hypothetical protein
MLLLLCCSDCAAAAAAAEDAEVVIELMPSMSSGYYQKGCALHQLHDYAGAVSTLG